MGHVNIIVQCYFKPGVQLSGAQYIVPVSYTHLDVYKRQALGCGLLEGIHRNHCAALCKCNTGGSANAGSAAGDQDAFAGKIHTVPP